MQAPRTCRREWDTGISSFTWDGGPSCIVGFSFGVQLREDAHVHPRRLQHTFSTSEDLGNTHRAGSLPKDIGTLQIRLCNELTTLCPELSGWEP